MKLNEKAWANASALVMGFVYLACSFLVAIFPNFFRAVSQSWLHGIDLGAIWTGEPRGNFVLGLITAVGASWVTGWGFARLYNRLLK